MNKIAAFIKLQIGQAKCRRVASHPISKALRMISDQQTSISDQWVRDLEFRAKSFSDLLDLIDIEHYNQLQALNDTITGLGRMYPAICQASTTGVIDIKALQLQIHAKVGVTKTQKAQQLRTPKVTAMAANGGKP